MTPPSLLSLGTSTSRHYCLPTSRYIFSVADALRFVVVRPSRYRCIVQPEQLALPFLAFFRVLFQQGAHFLNQSRFLFLGKGLEVGGDLRDLLNLYGHVHAHNRQRHAGKPSE